MDVYSLTETTGNAGCYGVFTSIETATEYALTLFKDWDYNDVEETFYDGFKKEIYYGESGCFEICRHKLDAT